MTLFTTSASPALLHVRFCDASTFAFLLPPSLTACISGLSLNISIADSSAPTSGSLTSGLARKSEETDASDASTASACLSTVALFLWFAMLSIANSPARVCASRATWWPQGDASSSEMAEQAAAWRPAFTPCSEAASMATLRRSQRPVMARRPALEERMSSAAAQSVICRRARRAGGASQHIAESATWEITWSRRRSLQFLFCSSLRHSPPEPYWTSCARSSH